jgi:hypothetical protein
MVKVTPQKYSLHLPVLIGSLMSILAGCVETDREYADRVCRMGGHSYGTPQYSQCYQAAFGQAQAQSMNMVRTGTNLMSPPPQRPPVTCRTLGNTMTCQ